MSALCEICGTNRTLCEKCRCNPNYQNLFTYPKEYEPVCPRGYVDCVRDPGYIKFYYPDWYQELYGDKTPKEAIHIPNGCFERFLKDPNEEGYCYDDEDK